MSKDDLQDQLEGLFSGSVPKPDEPSPTPEAPVSETPASETPVPRPEPVADVPLPQRVSAFEQTIVLGGAPDTEGAPSPPKGTALPEPAPPPGVAPAPAAEPPERGAMPEPLASSAQAPPEAAPPSSPLSAARPPRTSRGSMLSLGRQPDEALSRLVEQPLDVSLQAERLEQGRIHILNLLLGGAMIGGGIAVLALLVGVLQKPSRLVSDLPFFFAYLLIVTMFFARKLPSLLRMSVLFGVAYLVSFFSALLNGVVSTAPWYLLAATVLYFVLIGPRAGIVSGIAHVLAYAALALSFRLGWLTVQSPVTIESNVSQFWVIIASFMLIIIVISAVQWLFARAQRQITLSLQERGEALRRAREASELGQRELAEINETLRRQTAYFELGAEVGRLSIQATDAAKFVSQAVRLVRERANLYDVSLFLLDASGTVATLQDYAAQDVLTGVDRPLSLPTDNDSILGQCVLTGQARIASTRQHLVDMPGILPETQSGFCLPLIAQDKMMGTILIQSREPDAFREEDIAPLRTVADQMAVTIAYDRAVLELRERLSELETMQRYYIQEAWNKFLLGREAALFQYTQPGIDPLDEQDVAEFERFLAQSGSPEAGSPSTQDVVLPIEQRGHVVGLLGLQMLEQGSGERLTEGQIDMVHTISEQMGLILDNARLLEEARTRASQERRVSDITARMRATLDVDTVLRTAMREISETLDLSELVVRVGTPQDLLSQGTGGSDDKEEALP